MRFEDLGLKLFFYAPKCIIKNASESLRPTPRPPNWYALLLYSPSQSYLESRSGVLKMAGAIGRGLFANYELKLSYFKL